MRLRYTRRARLDIAEIHDYIARENASAARRVVQIIRTSAETLLHNPLAGRAGRIAETRELTISRVPFMLPSRIEADQVQILAVVHTARVWPESL